MPNCSCSESSRSSDETSDDDQSCSCHKRKKHSQSCSRRPKDVCKRCYKPKNPQNTLTRDVCKKKDDEPKEDTKDDANKKQNGCIFITIR